MYDLLTIERCLDYGRSTTEASSKGQSEVKARAMALVTDLSVYFIKGERFKDKSQTIEEWMHRDRERDERVEKARTPSNDRCNFCSSRMNLTSKELHHDDIRVMFWFECPECKKRKLLFDDGEEYKVKPKFCPQCSYELAEASERKGETITTKTVCPNCKYKTNEVMDFEKDRKEWEEKERKDKELLRKYRGKYCLSEKEGNEYVQSVTQMKMLMDHLNEREQKEADPAYQKAKQLKILRVLQVKDLVRKAIEKDGYVDLQFDKPEIDRFVIIGFTVTDSNESREKHDSIQKLKRLVINVLKDTNWRLMSEGISYRLGILSGKLKAYESEEDLMRIVK